MNESVRPTKKQKEMLDFIDQFIASKGYGPSYREIMQGCNYASVATVAVHVNNLISKGHLQKKDHSARSLELVRASHSHNDPDNCVKENICNECGGLLVHAAKIKTSDGNNPSNHTGNS